MVDKQSSQVVADSPSTAIPRLDAPNCFLGAESGGEDGGMRGMIDDGDLDKWLPNFVSSRKGTYALIFASRSF